MTEMNRIFMGVLLGCSILTSGVANAAAYSVSVNSITNFGIAFSTATPFLGFTFTGDTAAVNGTSQGHGGLMDAAASCINCAYNNSFSSHGGASTSYAYGDTLIGNDAVLAGTGSAAAIGEAYLTGAAAGTGYGQGVNTLTAAFFVLAPTNATFDFWSDPYLQSALSVGGQWATANLAMTVTITQGLNTVFSWSPNGAAGGIVGGTEVSDPFSLNMGLPQLVNGVSSYNPGNNHYRAVTANLGAGTYNLNIMMSNTAQVQTVPVPAAVWLFGSGLLGFLGMARRQR